LSVAGGCVTSPPKGITPITGLELQRYLGTWYEIARLDHRFERGLSRVTAEYSLNEDGTIKVVNRGYNAQANEWDIAEGTAKFRGDETVGSLKVSFFGPFYGGYHIIDLDDDYQYAMVAGPSRNYLWILARDPNLDETTYQRLVEKAAELDFPAQNLIQVEHGD
jgi:apolipoprotein D and lipocalin family protein